MPRWSVDIIRHRAKHLGTVVAANENDAIKAAIATIEIEPARRNRPKISIASFAPRALAEFTSMTAAYDGLIDRTPLGMKVERPRSAIKIDRGMQENFVFIGKLRRPGSTIIIPYSGI